MMAESKAAELLALVEKSPQAVTLHDKQAWLSIFAKFHIVEDPVGSSAHIGGIYDAKTAQRGNGALSRFFDTFIAPNTICFEVAQDIVCGQHVVRDLLIHIRMSDKVEVKVPMHLLYELVQEDGEWKIQRLAAYWELLPMLGQLFGKGLAAVPIMAALSLRMMRLQGFFGMLGFSKAAINIGGKGKRAVEGFVDAFNSKDLAGIMGVSDSDANTIQWPNGGMLCSPSELLDKVGGQLQLTGKCLAAGDAVTAGVRWLDGEEKKTGVIVFEFNRKTQKISSLRAYLGDS